MIAVLTLFLSLLALSLAASEMPLPFNRELVVETPMMSGDDVIIAQNLLIRDSSVQATLDTDGVYGADSELATRAFQESHGLSVTGIFDSTTAELLLQLHSNDNFKDSGFTAASVGYLYKLYIPVHYNRSIGKPDISLCLLVFLYIMYVTLLYQLCLLIYICSVETTGTLYDAYNNVIMTFRARTHGHDDDGTQGSWPDFGTGDIGCNEFTHSCGTVTGLIEVDLNSPEPDPALYGPYPVNRFVRGLEGNAGFMLPNLRDGILLHTGNWSTDAQAWNSSMEMPNSSGCIHAHPEDIQKIYQELVKLGVKVHDNTFSGKDYPYKPQGIAVVSRID